MFHGSIVAIVTPMSKEGNIDYEALTGLVNFHLRNGTHGIVVVGTTGESATLNKEEKKHVIKHVVKEVNEQVPVIAGTGLTSTSATVELTQLAMELGVDGCLLMSPSVVKPTQEGLYQHFKTIANEVPIPQIIYNIPGRTACDILPETVSRLADLPNVIGIKEATGSIERVKQIIDLCAGRLDVYSGEDFLAKETMLVGGRGVISVTANIAPKLMSMMAEAAISGDKSLADELDNQLAELHRLLFVESNPIPVKWAVSQLGLSENGIRLPLTPFSSDKQAELQAAMERAGLIGA